MSVDPSKSSFISMLVTSGSLSAAGFLMSDFLQLKADGTSPDWPALSSGAAVNGLPGCFKSHVVISSDR